jgi:multisubunit Na+/H+ antiporter MnhC subunit
LPIVESTDSGTVAMTPITPAHYVILSAALFIIGVIGVMFRRNIIVIFMSIELMLNAVNINLIALSSASPRRRPPSAWASSSRSTGTRKR